jgi:P22_AR N-terminal domain
MNKIVTLNFRGTEIYGFQSGEIVFVAVKPIVLAMGLSWGSQYNRLRRDPILSEGIFMMKIPFAEGGPQEMLCLRLDLVHGWLFTIDSGRIKDTAVRSKVQVYQRECYGVLYSHFSGERDKLKREANETESLSLRLVSECRHIWGNRSAAELWERRGLPTVPAMDAVFRQNDLFEHATLVPRSVAA